MELKTPPLNVMMPSGNVKPCLAPVTLAVPTKVPFSNALRLKAVAETVPKFIETLDRSGMKLTVRVTIAAGPSRVNWSLKVNEKKLPPLPTAKGSPELSNVADKPPMVSVNGVTFDSFSNVKITAPCSADATPAKNRNRKAPDPNSRTYLFPSLIGCGKYLDRVCHRSEQQKRILDYETEV